MVCVLVLCCGNSGARTAVFNELAIKYFQYHIINHPNNCSSVGSDKFQLSLVVSPQLSVVLVYFCIAYVLKGSVDWI